MKTKNIILFGIIIVLLNFGITTYLIQRYNASQSTQQVLEVLSSRPVMERPIVDSSTLKDSQQTKDLPQFGVPRENAITNAVNLVQSSVVSVNVVKTEIVRADPFGALFFDFWGGFFPRQFERQVESLGSGVIISEDGYIITNSHVVEGATEIKVICTDGSSFDAELVGHDIINDIAVLKIKGKNLPFAKLGDSDTIIIGEWAIAIGNPFGFVMKDPIPTVTVGVISAIERNFHLQADNKVYKKMIQTDAAINPGNSGGPLVNVNGEVIGINSFIFTKSGGSLGIGFAIPINRVRSIAQEIITYGGMRPIWFGFKVQDITPAIAYNLGLKDTKGVIVSYIDEGGPADEAGLKRGDIIIKINDQVVKNADDAEIAVADLKIGEEVKLVIIRNGEERTITLIPQEYKEKSSSFFKL
jgi:serine protease Do